MGGMQHPSRPLLQDLERSGRFHRDTRLGRIFHPGTTSYRELSTTDSVHLVSTSDNRLSVHVDRVSPVLVRGTRARYSVSRAVAHNAAVIAEAVCRLVRREKSDHRCHLDCEIRWIPDEELDGDGEDEDEAGPDGTVGTLGTVGTVGGARFGCDGYEAGDAA